MIKVLLEGPVLTKSGYGEHARLVYRSISKNKNLDIFINPLNWGTCSWALPDEQMGECINKFRSYSRFCESNKQNPDYAIQIHVGIPSEFEKKAPYSVCVTAGIETDRASPNWIFKTNQGIDKIVVPSEHARSGLANTGYEVINKSNDTRTELVCACPVEVVPYPVKDMSGKKLDIDFETDFNFLQIAMMGPRKNIETSIRCFVEQFRENNNVGLVLKTSLSKSTIIDRVKLKKHMQNYVDSLGPKKCKIYLIHGNLTESEIHSLYTHPKIKAYFTTTHGEGFGLPIFEAAYSGIPVIATDWSGHIDFLTGKMNGKKKKLFAKIAYSLKEVQPEAVWEHLIVKESKWAFPQPTSVKEQLKKVYNNYGMYNKWAKKLKESLLETHNDDKITEMMSKAIIGDVGSPEEEVVVFK